MSLASMTGFGRSRGRLSDRYGASLVVRSVNHRYLDVQIRTNLREEVPEVEAVIRSAVEDRLQRGRVTTQLSIERSGTASAEVAVNSSALMEVLEQLAALDLPVDVAGTVTLRDVLAIPGLVAVSIPEAMLDEGEMEALRKLAGEAVAGAAEMRAAEGAALSRKISEDLEAVAGFLDWFEPQMPVFRERIKDRVAERVATLVGTEIAIDPDRVLQEAAMLADKADVAEETVRLRSHLQAFRARLATGGAVGRTLDFLCQEVHRELNTLGTKCRELGVADRLVEAKGAVERVREQVQNLE